MQLTSYLNAACSVQINCSMHVKKFKTHPLSSLSQAAPSSITKDISHPGCIAQATYHVPLVLPLSIIENDFTMRGVKFVLLQGLLFCPKHLEMK